MDLIVGESVPFLFIFFIDKAKISLKELQICMGIQGASRGLK